MIIRPLLSTRLVFGLVLMALGVLWTLDQVHVLDASRVLAWWPALALAWGILVLTGVCTRRRTTLGGIWIAVGLVGLLAHLGVWRLGVEDLLPLFLVFVGGLVMVRGWRGTRFERATGQGATPGGGAGAAPGSGPGSAPGGPSDPGAQVNLFTLLSGAERRVVSQSFTGGEVSAILGGLLVDLRGAQLAQGRAMLDIFAMWGGVEVLAPPGWRVVNRVTPLLGAVVDAMPEPSGPDAPVLELRGLAIMGGVDVRSDDRLGRKFGRAVIGARIGPSVQVGVIRTRRGDRFKGPAPDETGED